VFLLCCSKGRSVFLTLLLEEEMFENSGN